jgi:RNA polymerase-binding transcription factor DksA
MSISLDDFILKLKFFPCLAKFKCYHLGVMLNKKKIKEQLEQERDILIEQMQDMGKLNPETGEWDATPQEVDGPESDHNDMADRFEDFEAKSSMIKSLESRLQNILKALSEINKVSFGKCEVCKKDIEMARMKVNPAARTCKKHLENN